MSLGPIGVIQRSWERRPLSTQLVVVITALLAVGLMMSGTVMIGLLQRHLISQVDQQLTTAATSPLSISAYGQIDTSEAALPTLYYIRREAEGEQDTEIYYAETLEASGTPLIPTLLDVGEEAETTSGTTTPITVQSTRKGSTWRAIAMPIYSGTSNKPIGVMTIALPLTDVQHTLRTTGLYMTTTALVIVIVGGSIGNWLVRRSLSALRSIESTAGKIAAGDLTQRVEPGPSTTEVGSLSLSLNSMLAQVEQSFEARQASERKIRRFVSDASHELRTPLAAITGYCELYSMGGVPQERVDEVMGRISSESTRMTALVEDLLTLARLDEGRPMEFTDLDLVKLADNAVFDLQALDSSRSAAVQSLNGLKPPMTLVVRADRDRLQQVFTNLIGNIIRYTPEGSPVEIALGASHGRAIVEFRDHGPGIADADRSKVFERFYRADSSRNRSTGGSGLGLAIVSGIIGAHHGSAELMKTKGGGLTVRIELPIDSGKGAKGSTEAPATGR